MNESKQKEKKKKKCAMIQKRRLVVSSDNEVGEGVEHVGAVAIRSESLFCVCDQALGLLL